MLKNDTITQNINSFYIGTMITSVIGGILLLFTDFASWDASNYYYGYLSYGWIGANLDEPLYLILFVILAGCLFYCAYVSYLGFSGKSVPFNLINIAFLLSAGVLAVVIFGALLFIVIISMEDVWWWFDAGFYGGLLGSFLSTVFLYQIRKVSSPKMQ